MFKFLLLFVTAVIVGLMSQCNNDPCSALGVEPEPCVPDAEDAEGHVEDAINELQDTLAQNYLRAEKLMALRRPNTGELSEVSAKIDQLYVQLMGAHIVAKTDSKVVAATSQNKAEFDSRKFDWLSANIAGTSVEQPLTLDQAESSSSIPKNTRSISTKRPKSSSSKGSHSSSSTTISLKRVNAEIEFETALLEAEQLNERLEEQSEERNLQTQIQQREAQRKIELARRKREILKEFSLQHCRPKSIKSNHSGRSTSKRSTTKGQVQPSGEVSKQVGIGHCRPGGISERVLGRSCLHSGGLTERVSSSVSLPTPAKVTIQMPQVSSGRFTRPQLVESPSLSAAAQPFVPTVSMGRTSPLQRPSVVENPTVLEPYHAYGHYPLNHEAVPHDKFRRTEVASLNPMQPGVMAYSVNTVPIVSQHPSGQEQRTAMSNQPPIQVSGTVIHPSVLSTSPQEVTPSRCEAPASVAYPTPKQEDNSFFFNGNVRHTTRTQSTHPAAEGQTHVHRYSLQPGNELSCMPYPGQQSSYVPGRPSYDSMFLPRPEFPKYSGDPLEYSSFINNFETHVEPRVKDQNMLFCLLTQHCVNSVRERIQHLEGKEQCYQLAKQKLLKEYGSPWIVADVCEQKLKSFSSIVSGDSKQIKWFAELLEKTYSIMTGISNFGSLDSLDSLTMLVTKLPYELRRRWVDKSVEIQSVTGSLAKFKHFVEFVQRESEIVNSLFGLRNLTTKSDKSRGGKVKVSSYGISTTHNSANSQKEPNPLLKVGVCWFCNRTSHKFTTCEFFLAKSVKERSSFVKKHKLCHKCLSSRHRTPDCKKTRTCSIEGCNGTFHHTLLHYSNETKQRHEPLQEKSTVSTQTGQEKTVGCAVMRPDPHSNSDVYLCVVPVVVSHNGKEVCTYAFLDQGSTHTFCSSDLVNSLQIDGSYSNISLQTINGIKRDCSSTVCELIISDLDKENLFVLPNVFSVDKIPVKPNKIRNKNILDMPHLQDISFKELGGAEVSVLIGADVPEMFCIRSYRKGTHGGPTAIETPLGWSLLGPSLSPSFTTNCKVNFIRKQEDDLHQLVNTLWDADFQPGTGVLDTPNSSEDRNALQRLTTSITTTDDGRYQLPLLWKEDYPSLPNNLEMAKQRLSSLKRRLLKDPSLKAKYTEVVENYVSKGHARRMNFDGGQRQSKISWYLPHHPVINPHKSKIRVVFDCAAKTCNTSLNDKLVRGPDLMNSLIGVLIRFRKELVVLVADVEQMFHQVKVHPEHRDALRFLWWPNGDLDQDPVPYQMTVHIFGAKSSPCCANFCLRQTAVEFGHLFEPGESQIVQDSFYVDDCLVSLPTIQEAISAQRGLRELLAKRGFRLRKWITNSEEVLRCIPESERATISQAHPLDETTNETNTVRTKPVRSGNVSKTRPITHFDRCCVSSTTRTMSLTCRFFLTSNHFCLCNRLGTNSFCQRRQNWFARY